MAKYLNTATGQYPLHDGDIEVLVPGWTPGDELPSHLVEVQEVNYPGETEDFITIEGAPVLVDGIYKMNWELRPMTEAEKAMRDTPLPVKDGVFNYVWNYDTFTWEEAPNNL